MDYKKSKAPVNTVTRNIMDLCEDTGNGYTFLLRKFNGQLSVSLIGYASGNTSDNNIQNVCKNIPEADVTEVCKILSEKFACRVSIRKGYEVYGNANVFNGGSDYEIIEEKWFSVEFDNGCQNMT